MNEKYFPVVVQAIAGEGYTVYAYFSDGSIHLYDMNELVSSGGVFEPLRDRDFFVNKLTVLNDSVAWDLSGKFDPTNCIDIDPFEVYASARVEDPIAVTA